MEDCDPEPEVWAVPSASEEPSVDLEAHPRRDCLERRVLIEWLEISAHRGHQPRELTWTGPAAHDVKNAPNSVLQCSVCEIGSTLSLRTPSPLVS